MKQYIHRDIHTGHTYGATHTQKNTHGGHTYDAYIWSNVHIEIYTQKHKHRSIYIQNGETRHLKRGRISLRDKMHREPCIESGLRFCCTIGFK